MLASVSYAFQPQPVSAEQIQDRSLTLLANGSVGGSTPGGIVNHQFTFTTINQSNQAVGSILFEYCTIASVEPCVTPEGVDTLSATLLNQTGASTGFTLNNSTQGKPYLTRTAVDNEGASTYVLGNVKNPDIQTPAPQPNYTFFVRISTYASTNATGTPIDTGTVAASTARQLELSGTMPESLIFCAAEAIALNGGGIPDCSTANDGSITFDQLFSPSDTATAESQMAASTNAGDGYVITVNGPTLTSGTNTIAGMAAQAAPTTGIPQFGLNVVANTTTLDRTDTPLGAAIAPASNGTDLRANPAAGYEIADQFKFNPAENIVARSDNGGPGPTNSQIYTVSYIVNVPGSQPAGTYVSTLTYICTPTF